MFGLALAVLALVHLREAPAELRRTHLSVPLSATATLGSFALSPDGRSVVMGYEGGYGIRSLESGETRMLGGLTSGGLAARTPFFSADSRNIAFFGDRKLKTAAASGGPPRTLCEGVGLGGGGTWNRAGEIVFATEAGALLRVSAEGGPCTELTKPEQGLRRTIPVFLPDGEHFLYVASSLDEARRGVFVASLGDPIGRRLLADQSSAIFVPNGPGANQGHLLFVREQALMAAAFDAASRQLSGEPVTVARPVSFTNATPQMPPSPTLAGTTRSKLMAASIDQAPNPVGIPRTLFEFETILIVPQGNVFSYAPSADGQRFVINVLSTDARPSLDVILNWGQTQSGW